MMSVNLATPGLIKDYGVTVSIIMASRTKFYHVAQVILSISHSTKVWEL